MSTLYRKYRPQTFENVIGQTHIIQTITNEISMGRVAQAYLFSGSRGVGKTTTARLLAKAMNCQNRKDGKFEPCEECLSCKEITGGRSIDVIEIDAASQTGVDNVRENIIENAQFKPTASKFKIFIIDEVHMLSNSSFNALLKTLEEPPAHAIFILATTELHKLPDTVISRCQRSNFKKIKFDDMLKRLEELAKSEGVKIDKDVLKRIINKSDGCLRDAESLLGQIFSLNIKKITTEDAQMILPTADAETVLNYVECLIQKNAGDAIRTVNHLGESGASLDQFAHDLLEILRLMIIGQSGATLNNATDYSQEVYKKIKELSQNISSDRLVAMIEKAMLRKTQIKSSPIPQLPLELLAVEFCGEEKNINSDNEQKQNPITAENKPTEKKPLNNPAPTKTISSTIKNAIADITHKHPISTTFEQIQNEWPNILEKLSESNHSLIFILKMCSLEKLDGNKLRVSVPFVLHKEKVEEPKSKKVIEDCLNEIFSENIIIKAEVNSEEKNSTVPESEIQNLAAQFGGEVV
ncbi:DNA polymerase III subunit gamma/tau [Patescibacteria group bacterium]|nr:DNA polymerase III subunit gamma/tau [Patescibacteria group bacterium]